MNTVKQYVEIILTTQNRCFVETIITDKRVVINTL